MLGHPIQPYLLSPWRILHLFVLGGVPTQQVSLYDRDSLDITRRHTFTNYVMEAQLPFMWKGLNIDRYDGTTDPDEHMDIYTTHMSLYTSNNVVLCRFFPNFTKGESIELV